jgi:hypothetical protein
MQTLHAHLAHMLRFAGGALAENARAQAAGSPAATAGARNTTAAAR